MWWEGLTEEPPPHLTDWRGRDWTPDSPEPAAHPNSRFTTPASQCPIIAPEWDDPAGVPISAILFGGRRASTVPLVIESFDWDHGVFLGANIASEKTAAAEGRVGELRHDPFAMLPFCGYNMGDYFGYWLKIGRTAPDPAKLPRLFYVNWFRKDATGRFVWPGFGENIRVLKWIIQRLSGDAKATRTPIGYLPAPGSLDLDGLDITWADLDLLLTVDTRGMEAGGGAHPRVLPHLSQAPARPAVGAAPGAGGTARLGGTGPYNHTRRRAQTHDKQRDQASRHPRGGGDRARPHGLGHRRASRP